MLICKSQLHVILATQFFKKIPFKLESKNFKVNLTEDEQVFYVGQYKTMREIKEGPNKGETVLLSDKK